MRERQSIHLERAHCKIIDNLKFMMIKHVIVHLFLVPVVNVPKLIVYNGLKFVYLFYIVFLYVVSLFYVVF